MLKIISGKYRGRKLFSPKEGVRPSSGQLREALFNIIGPSIEGMRVLDLFAGTGAVGIEALSRGAESVTFVEKRPDILKKNLDLLGLEERVLACDVFRALDGSYDLIFADPPYGQGIGADLVRAIDQSTLAGQLFVEEQEIESLTLERWELTRVRSYGKSQLYCYGLK